MSRHLVIMAAGTGGHVIPGLAVAQAMRARGWGVSWLGTSHGMENTLVPPAGLAMDCVVFSGLRGKGWRHSVVGVWRLFAAFFSCLRILRGRKANAVLGMGGYVCLPGGLAAACLRQPLMLVNADAALLMSNRALAPFARKIAFGFAGPASQGLRKAVVTGNPVRAPIAALPEPAARFAGRTGALRVLVVGGSLGAQVLNTTVPQALALLPSEAEVRVVHQTGAAHLADVQAAYRLAGDLAGVSAQVLPFIDDMAQQLADCDVIVCRAGAITVSELCAAGVASVLVPLVVSTTSHQRDNAQWMADQGAAIHLPQQNLTAQSLADLLTRLRRPELLTLATQARRLARPASAEQVADTLEGLAA